MTEKNKRDDKVSLLNYTRDKMDPCGFINGDIIKVQVAEIKIDGVLLVETYSKNGKKGLIPSSLRGEHTSVSVGESLYVTYLEEFNDYLLFASDAKIIEIECIAEDFKKWSSKQLILIPNVDKF